MGRLSDAYLNRIWQIIKGDISPDATLYARLYTDAQQPAKDAALSAISEVSGNGYAANSVALSGATITANELIFPQQLFTPSGGNWNGVTGIFFATTADDSGVLVGTFHFDTSEDVQDGTPLSVAPTFKLTN